jgi:hypothetical protein
MIGAPQSVNHDIAPKSPRHVACMLVGATARGLAFARIRGKSAMATINWINGSDVDDWFTASNWAGSAVPGAGDTAVIKAHGHYEVHFDAAVTVQELDFDYKSVFLIEDASGSLTAHKFDIVSGIAEFGNANTIDNVQIEGGDVVIGDDHALGTKAIHFHAGTIIANANVNLHNKIDIQASAGLSAMPGDTLTVSGPIEVNEAFSEYGISFGGFTHNKWFGTIPEGTVNITSTSFDPGTSGATEDIFVMYGTVKSGQGTHAVGADTMFSDAGYVQLSSGTSVLDVRNFGTDVTLNQLNGVGTLIGNAAVTVHMHDPNFQGVLKGVTMVLDGTGHIGGDVGHSHITMAAGTNTMDFSATVSGLFTLAAPDGSTSTITVGGQTSEHITDFQDGNLTIDTTTASTAHYNLEIESGDVRLVVHPGGGANVYSMFFDGLTSTDGITVGDDGHGHLQVTWTDPAGATAHTAHDIDVMHQVAQALLVPASHDQF